MTTKMAAMSVPLHSGHEETLFLLLNSFVLSGTQGGFGNYVSKLNKICIAYTKSDFQKYYSNKEE